MCVLGAGRREPPALTVKAARTVALERPVQLHRDAASVETSAPVLITVSSPRYNSYLAMNITPPLFMFGAGVCMVVRDLDQSNTLDLLCPPVAGAEQSFVWLTSPGAFPKDMTAARTALDRPLAIEAGYGIRVEVAKTAPLRFASESELRASLRPVAPDGGTP
jgi:hypothetical protein